MQENEFEKRVRNELNEFSIVPNSEVWLKVQAQIRQEKRRRLLVYWFLAAVLLTAITTTIFLINNSNNIRTEKVRVASRPVSEVKLEKQITKRQPAISKPKKQLINGAEKTRPNMAVFLKAGKNHVDGNSKNDRPSRTILEEAFLRPGTEQQSAAVNENGGAVLRAKKVVENKEFVNNQPIARLEGKSILPPHKYLLGEKTKLDTTKTAITNSTKAKVSDTLVTSVSTNKITQPCIHRNAGKWTLGFSIYSGSSGNVRGLATASQKSFADANFSTAFPSSVNLATPVAPPLSYENSGSFGIGVYAERTLTKKTIVSVGVDYHFMSSKSVVGNKVDSALTVFDSLLQKTAVTNAFYRAGQTATFSNQYHLLQLPVSLQFQFNNNSKHPLLFGAGLVPSLMIASDALYLNNKINGYYQEKEQFNRFLLFGRTEVLYALTDRERFRLSIGPTIEYDFTSFSKAVINHPQHFIFTGLKAHITFK